MEVLTCEVGPHRLALDIGGVREVFRAVAITPLPGAAAAVDGLVDIRGERLPVVNGRRRFGVPARQLSPDEYFIRVSAGPRDMLLRVDGVTGFSSLPELTASVLADVVAADDAISGVAALPDGLVLLHDPEKFLTAAESEALTRVLREAAG